MNKRTKRIIEFFYLPSNNYKNNERHTLSESLYCLIQEKSSPPWIYSNTMK